MDAVVLGLRVLLSLGVVLALLYVLHRRVSKLNGNRAGAGLLSVVARQGIGAKASVVVLDAEGTRFYLGVTDQSVAVLHSTAVPRALQSVPGAGDPPAPLAAVAVPPAPVPSVPSVAPVPARAARSSDADFAASLRVALDEEPAFATRRAARAARSAPASRPVRSAPLQGSILSPATWKQTAAFLRHGRAG
ncbi:flagellar biosynthetic protein FliO [uncultured Arthrobacter sp.]|uniref:FliO/MopB family protein n=1 Tax=uncultured Arthrobacter sp. TaxID=114050 RepID=UPI00263897A3|nr:flagellar biosynthetic protein FliO [uncultured Arthrobacter sp.]